MDTETQRERERQTERQRNREGGREGEREREFDTRTGAARAGGELDMPKQKRSKRIPI